MGKSPISDLTPSRLSSYLRCLETLEAAGVATVSSAQVEETFGLSAVQVRKDLGRFGAFGKRGVGYAVSDLRQQLKRILGLDTVWRIAIIGAGNLGTALANYDGFRHGEFQVVACFEVDPAKVGTRTRHGTPILPMEELESLAARQAIDIAILAIPAPVAQAVVDRLSALGVQAILNFAPTRCKAAPGMKVKEVDVKQELEVLAFYRARQGEEGLRPPRAAG